MEHPCRRKWDNKLDIILKVSAVISLFWAIFLYVNTVLVTEDELDKQRKYTDYQVVRIKIQIVKYIIELSEEQMAAGIKLSPVSERRYNDAVKTLPILEEEFYNLGKTF